MLKTYAIRFVNMSRANYSSRYVILIATWCTFRYIKSLVSNIELT